MASGPDEIPVDSRPQKAKVFLNGQYQGQTPLEVRVQRDQAADIRLEYEGMNSITIHRNKVFNGWFVGNILIGGLIGIVIDAATDNVTKYSDTPVVAVFEPAGSAGMAANKAVRVPMERVPANASPAPAKR